MSEDKELNPATSEVPATTQEAAVKPAKAAETNDPAYIIDGILPAHEIHLMGGPSGAGKTTLCFQMLWDIRHNEPVFGLNSHSVPMCYVACDRSKEATERTLQRMRVEVDFPILSLVPLGIAAYNIEYVIEAALKLEPNTRLLVIDAIGSLVPGGKINDYRAVLMFLTKVSALCHKHHITILAMGHSTKVKEGEDFKNARQKFLGSVAWGGFSETMFYIEPANPEDVRDTTRQVLVLPRNGECLDLQYMFNKEGRLIPVGDVNADLVLDTQLLKVDYEALIPTKQLLLWAEESGIPKRTAERWITEAVKGCKLTQVKKGFYKRCRVS